MNQENMHNLHQRFGGKKKYLLVSFLTIFNILLVFLVVWLGVAIQNSIKQGRYIGRDIESRETITVSGQGEVYAKPDLALIDFSVISQAKTVDGAMADNTGKMNGVIDFIKGLGVGDKDLKTTNFNIYPRYEWQEAGTCFPPCPVGRRALVGYEVHQSLQVKIRDMEKIGEIIQGSTAAGANEVGSLRFTIDNQDELKKQARAEAIEKAKIKAKELSSQLEVKLVRITNFSEGSSLPRSYDFSEAAMMGKGMEEQALEPDIETGENKIEINVSITYEIR